MALQKASSETILSFLEQQVVKEKTTNFYNIILLLQHCILRQLFFTVFLLQHSTLTKMCALYVELRRLISRKQKACSVTSLGK